MKIKTTLLCTLGLVGFTSLPCQAATVETPGFLKYECWFPPLRDATLVGADVVTLWQDPHFSYDLNSAAPNVADMTSYAAGLNTRSVFPDDSHNQYGVRITGWITPTVTDDYNFYLASDDASQLYISYDATDGNANLVAEETGCSMVSSIQATRRRLCRRYTWMPAKSMPSGSILRKRRAAIMSRWPCNRRLGQTQPPRWYR